MALTRAHTSRKETIVSRLQASAAAVAAVAAVWPTKNRTNLILIVTTLIFLPTRRSKRGTFYSNVSGWVAGWRLADWVAVHHTRWHCIKMAKHIWKSFTTFWKHHHSSFLRPLNRYTIPRGTPSAGALNTQGRVKLAIFVLLSTDIAVYLGNGVR